jgi:hypothetical protein
VEVSVVHFNCASGQRNASVVESGLVLSADERGDIVAGTASLSDGLGQLVERLMASWDDLVVAERVAALNLIAEAIVWQHAR